MRICWAKGISNIIRAQGYMEDYRGVFGDAEVEMNYIEDQLNHVILDLNLPTEEQLLQKLYSFFDPSLQRIHVKIPIDLKTRLIIDKVAKQVAEQGSTYEDELKRIILKKKRITCDILFKVYSQED